MFQTALARRSLVQKHPRSRSTLHFVGTKSDNNVRTQLKHIQVALSPGHIGEPEKTVSSALRLLHVTCIDKSFILFVQTSINLSAFQDILDSCALFIWPLKKMLPSYFLKRHFTHFRSQPNTFLPQWSTVSSVQTLTSRGFSGFSPLRPLTSTPLSVSLRCIKGLWCYLCSGMPQECTVLTTLHVRTEKALSAEQRCVDLASENLHRFIWSGSRWKEADTLSMWGFLG